MDRKEWFMFALCFIGAFLLISFMMYQGDKKPTRDKFFIDEVEVEAVLTDWDFTEDTVSFTFNETGEYRVMFGVTPQRDVKHNDIPDDFVIDVRSIPTEKTVSGTIVRFLRITIIREDGSKEHHDFE